MIALTFPEINEPSELAQAQVHLWRWAVPLQGSLAEELTLLSESERQRAARLKNDHQRRMRISSRAGMRRLLGYYQKCAPASVEIVYGPLGRPHLKHGDGLNFNVSHSGDWVVVAVAMARKLGIDIESVRQRLPSDRLIARICSPREQLVLAALSNAERTAAFFRMWTRKEAIMKATGGSIFHAPSNIDVSLGESAQPVIYGSRRDDWSLHHFSWSNRQLAGRAAGPAGEAAAPTEKRQPATVVGALAIDAGSWHLLSYTADFHR